MMKQLLILGTATTFGWFVADVFIPMYGFPLGAVVAAPICILVGFGVSWIGNEYL